MAGWLVKNVSAPTRSAPARSRRKAAKAVSISCSVLALRIRTCWPMARAAFCTSRDWVSDCSLLGFTSMAINVEPGTSSRSSSSRFASSSTPIIAMPVTFPPGKLDRVGGHVEDNWNDRCYRLGGHGSRGAADRNDHGSVVTVDQLRREYRQPIVMTLRPAVFEPHILSFDVAYLF